MFASKPKKRGGVFFITKHGGKQWLELALSVSVLWE